MNDLPSPTMPLSLVSLPRGSLHRSVPATGSHSVQGGISVAWASHVDEVRQHPRRPLVDALAEAGAKRFVLKKELGETAIEDGEYVRWEWPAR